MERPATGHDEITGKQFFLKGVIDRAEADIAVIHLDSGQEVLWPRTQLPPDAREGSAVRLLLTTSESDEAERVRIAKSLLNEILDTSS